MTICWWDGGNILEAFLEILERNQITNYLIGVMDDETEVGDAAVLWAWRWRGVHTHQGTVCEPWQGRRKDIDTSHHMWAQVYLTRRARPVKWFRVHIHIPEVQAKSHPANQVEVCVCACNDGRLPIQ